MNTNGAPGPYGITPRTDDAAFQPPKDLARDIPTMRAKARVIHREVPNVITQGGWSVADVRSALVDLTAGLFDRPSQLHDAIAGDSRVQSAMRSRSGGLLGNPIRFQLPKRYRDEPLAKKCLRAWENHWPQMAAEPALIDILESANGVGHSYAQLLWDTSREVWKPYLQSFGSRYAYYHWTERQHMAITLDGQVPVTPGDGHWVMHAPFGRYRGWMRGALRALAQWWLARNYALRDWARYSERHGFPILLADTPFGADPADVASYTTQLSGIGQESVLQLPGGPDITKYGKYDLRYLEPNDASWQAFKSLIDQCNDEITLALLGQNLTTQVKEGSFAAARVHADVKQAIIQADARSLSKTVYSQIARPFAALNFGNADFAPLVQWDVRVDEDMAVKARTFQSFAGGLVQLRTAGFQMKNPEKFARRFGLSGMRLSKVDPVQIEAQLARATGKDDEKTDEEQDDSAE